MHDRRRRLPENDEAVEDPLKIIHRAEVQPDEVAVLPRDAVAVDDLGVEYGRIRENFTIEGADVHEWPVGQRVRIGEAEFEITMVCDPCSRMDEIRPGLQAEIDGKRGMLARVTRTGEVAAGDAVELL